ncbi:uncharacterized protein LOC111891938 [Lactuca sativa]|uniref:uncharacterized protein LOC111891938 n=1 Tax=Lactuca sativa TaxID=4236 RepID=UPI000CD82873|nr:uncharacterized protein LOC111891938 [Lactuca sativa]
MPKRPICRKKYTVAPPPPPPRGLAHIHNGNNGGVNGQGTGNSNHGMSQGPTKVCTYKDFSNAKPLTFNETSEVINLKHWIEKIESVFEICECLEESRVKFVDWMFVNRALSQWNGYVEALRLPVANAMLWEELKEMMLAEYCPRGEIQKLEQELWNITVQNSDIEAYIARFSELALLCLGMITSEGKKIERFIWGLTPLIQGNMITANPKTFDNAKHLAHKLYDHGNKKGTKTTETEANKEESNKKNSGSKRKRGQSSGSSKKPQIVAVHAATAQTTPTPSAPTPITPNPTNPYARTLPKCNKCNFHHNGECREMQCTNCNHNGHTARYCRTKPQPNKQPNNNNVRPVIPAMDVEKLVILCKTTPRPTLKVQEDQVEF